MNNVQIIRKHWKALPLPANPNYRNDIIRFNSWLNSNRLAIGKESLEAYFNHLQNEGLKPSTLHRYKASLRKSMKELFGSNLTTSQNENINIFFKTIKITEHKDERGITENKILTVDELRSLLNVSGHKTALLIQALFETACRVSELCNVRLSNCKPYKNGIEIRITGKGNKSRMVFMSHPLFEKIRQTYRSKVFLLGSGKKPISRITVHTLIKRAGQKIGRPDIHAHVLRHTFATMNINRLGLPKVSKYLGHSNINVTTSFYLHGKASLEEILTNNKDILEG